MNKVVAISFLLPASADIHGYVYQTDGSQADIAKAVRAVKQSEPTAVITEIRVENEN